ncbi:division/cell wall cluster transcriptional repressor MraZ [Chitinibacter sp. S2-10]|uniref:division/cell wall cluster transcriptional repressor MraZ n=1 Tax=Chitinibacter sp. S2-10 TaxID=3373597 RepID=UPI003977B1A0
MFTGVSSLNLDSKGRLAVPAKHRDVLLVQTQGKLIITAGPSGCLLVYPEPEWLLVRDKLKTVPGIQGEQLRRVIIGHAEEIEMDASGRVLIPAHLRKVVGLDKEVALVGMDNKFELWDAEKWNATTAAVMTMNPQDLANAMQGVVL